jgi:hypothetical protein
MPLFDSSSSIGSRNRFEVPYRLRNKKFSFFSNTAPDAESKIDGDLKKTANGG